MEGLESPGHVASTAEELTEKRDVLLALVAGAGAGSLAAAGLTGPELGALRLKATDLRQRAEDAGSVARAEVERLEEEAKRKAKEEAERKAAEERAKEEAAEEEARKAAEEEAAAEAARQVAEQAERDRKAAQAPAQPPAQPQPIMPYEPSPPPPPPVAVYYKNCDAPRAAGAAPVLIGTPGYGRHLDRDGDGVGCE